MSLLLNKYTKWKWIKNMKITPDNFPTESAFYKGECNNGINTWTWKKFIRELQKNFETLDKLFYLKANARVVAVYKSIWNHSTRKFPEFSNIDNMREIWTYSEEVEKRKKSWT